MDLPIPKTIQDWNSAGEHYLPGLLGIRFIVVEPAEVVAELAVSRNLKAWNGYLHAGSVVTLADTCCGYGTLRSLPDGATGFTTIEHKCNFLETARDGLIRCRAWPLHRGRTTQVWDAEVAPAAGGKPIAHFRCTQMVLWPRHGA